VECFQAHVLFKLNNGRVKEERWRNERRKTERKRCKTTLVEALRDKKERWSYHDEGRENNKRDRKRGIDGHPTLNK
jgi:hypothetical protein